MTVSITLGLSRATRGSVSALRAAFGNHSATIEQPAQPFVPQAASSLVPLACHNRAAIGEWARVTPIYERKPASGPEASVLIRIAGGGLGRHLLAKGAD
jgi:hypothetical protein